MENKSEFLRETEAFIDKMQEFMSEETQPQRGLIVIAVDAIPDRGARAAQIGLKGAGKSLLECITALLKDKNGHRLVMTAVHFHQLHKIMADE